MKPLRLPTQYRAGGMIYEHCHFKGSTSGSKVVESSRSGLRCMLRARLRGCSHCDAYRRQSVAACDGGGRVGHAVRRRGRGAGRAWRAPARHCGAGVRGARCTPLARAPPAHRSSPPPLLRAHSRTEHSARTAPSNLQPAAACTGTTPYTLFPTHHNIPLFYVLHFEPALAVTFESVLNIIN